MTSDVCVFCVYRPCRCPFYAEDDRYEIGYDDFFEADEEA